MPGLQIPSIDSAQTGLERNALAYVAAMFSVAFLVLLAYHLRTMSRLYARQEALLSKFIETAQMLARFPDILTPLVYELQRKAPRRGGTSPGFRPEDLKKTGGE